MTDHVSPGVQFYNTAGQSFTDWMVMQSQRFMLIVVFVVFLMFAARMGGVGVVSCERLFDASRGLSYRPVFSSRPPGLASESRGVSYQ